MHISVTKYLKLLSHLGLHHSPAPLSHCHHLDSKQSLSLHHLSGWFERQL